MWPVERFLDDPMKRLHRFGLMRDVDRWMNHQIAPYWREADHSILHVLNQAKEFISDNKKFAVSLDVSHFKPEQLKEVKTDHSYMKKSFVHKWALPDDCDLDAVHTQIDNEGHLTVEAPKTDEHTNKRVLPILPALKKK